MLNTRLISLTLLICMSLSHLSLANNALEHLQPISLPSELRLVGKADFSVLWWDIYQAELYTANGQYTPDFNQLTLLKIRYQREISAQELLDETDNQWKKANISEQKRSRWLGKLAPLWPNVVATDEIAFYLDTQRNTHFYFNANYLGSVDDAEFSQAFADIWLSNKGSYPQLTRRLTGQ